MKNCTDLQQSKRLIEILPIESADNVIVSIGYNDGVKTVIMPKETLDIIKTPFSDIRKITPCWSLVALLDVLQDNIKIEKTLFDQSNMFTYSILGDGYEYRTYEHKNLINACYEMIVKLHEQNLLQL